MEHSIANESISITGANAGLIRFGADVERDHDLQCYSYRKATIGSIFVALRAGT